MAMTVGIVSAMRGFHDIILKGVPILLQKNETAFLSFMCSMAAIDALSGYRYSTDKIGERFIAFINEYFPPAYGPNAENLYKLRCRILHNFSPAYFSLVHARNDLHLKPSPIGDTILSDGAFFSDLKSAALKFFNEVFNEAVRQDTMNARLANVDKGGAIYVE